MNSIMKKLTNPTLVLSILSACKLIVQMFGVEIPDAELNNFANGICALVTIIGIIMSHDKPTAPTRSANVTTDKGPNLPATSAQPNNPTFTVPPAP